MFTSHKYAGFSKPSLFCDAATLPTSDPAAVPGVEAAGANPRKEYDYVIAGGEYLVTVARPSAPRRDLLPFRPHSGRRQSGGTDGAPAVDPADLSTAVLDCVDI